eukprot:CAMPEP_0204281638 /NCGR_PEP_ID=MMETSP0468-20130131/41411_1 /ASSEMBLY_ACC=CAM_ASM_000383 /TAXON_ID=2969 /ORGANISM="Oxyrrhis marina" /LENGTH=57 /DNA_ID=CAMNT_0051259023 /DNA_START=20 /DNA_END=190 /DNA_ORIENTATION=-
MVGYIPSEFATGGAGHPAVGTPNAPTWVRGVAALASARSSPEEVPLAAAAAAAAAAA